MNDDPVVYYSHAYHEMERIKASSKLEIKIKRKIVIIVKQIFILSFFWL